MQIFNATVRSANTVGPMADWCAQSTARASAAEEDEARELAYRRLAESVLINEFGREGKSEIVYLVPDEFSNVVPRMVRTISRLLLATKLSVTSPACPAAPRCRPRNCRRLCLAVLDRC